MLISHYLFGHLLLTLSIPSLCDQGTKNDAKKTEVKSFGVRGVKDSNDGGVKGSFVSAENYVIITLSSVISY